MDKPQRTEKEQQRFFTQCIEKFHAAAIQKGEVSFNYRIAGTVVRLNFAGSHLTPWLTPALEHLRIEPEARPAMTINAFDTSSTGINAPPPPCEWADFTDRGDIWGFNSNRIKTAFHWSEFSVNVMDIHNNTAVYWVKNPKAFPYWVYSSPFRTIIHWWMEKNDAQLLHAAAVGTADGAVLITGKGGSGKSTTALSCLNAGMMYLGDDYVIVKKDPQPKVFSLYSTAKLNTGDLEKFVALKHLAAKRLKANQEKDVFFLWPEASNQIKTEMPLRAILTPQIRAEEKTIIRPASFWPVQRAMAFTTMSQLPGVGSHTHQFVNDFVANLSCYTLRPGSKIDLIPAAISEFLSDPEKTDQQTPTQEEPTDKPLISVVVPLFNGEKFIAEAMQNITKQNYPAIEIIIVDDGSTDGSRELIENLEPDVRYFYQENAGPAAARNRGIRDASGEFIAFLDVDDLWPEENLNRLLAAFHDNPALSVVRGYAQLITINHNGETTFIGNPKESFPDYIGAGLYRKEVFRSVGLYDRALRFGEDTDWFNRARELNIDMKRLEEITLFVRRHDNNMTRGKNLLELNALKVFKKSLERSRKSQSAKKPADPAQHESKRPLVSVILPVRNGEHFISDALESVLSQEYRPLEIIVVDDGSTDNTPGVVENFDGSVRYFRQPATGVAAARNYGIREARGEFVAFIDADDLWSTRKLIVESKHFEENPETEIVIGFLHQIPLVKNPEIAKADVAGEKGIFLFSTGSCMVRRQVFDKIGLFDEQMKLFEDMDWFFRAREGGVKLKIHREALYYYRVHQHNLLANQELVNRYKLMAFKKSIDRRRKNGGRGSMQLPDLENINEILDFWQSAE